MPLSMHTLHPETVRDLPSLIPFFESSVGLMKCRIYSIILGTRQFRVGDSNHALNELFARHDSLHQGGLEIK